MKFKKNIFPLLFIFLPFFTSCSNDNVIDEDKFVKIYTDLVIAQDTTGNNKAVFDSLKLVIFKRYKVSEVQYDSTISYYNENVQRWEKFFDKATAYIQSLKNKNSTQP